MHATILTGKSSLQIVNAGESALALYPGPLYSAAFEHEH